MIRLLSILLLLTSLTSCGKNISVAAIHPQEVAIESLVTGVTSGRVEAEQHSVLAFGTVGRISRVDVAVGSVVTKGQILAQLENADLLASLAQAQREAERVMALQSANVLSDKEVEFAVERRDIALGAYEKSLIRAPFDGIITEKNIEEGQLSQITAVIPLAPLRIVDARPRYVVVAFDEVDLSRIKVGQRARVKVLAYQKERLLGVVRRVVSYISTAREQDRTVQVEVTLDELPTLLPVGASADVDIVTQEKPKALTIPSRAIMGRIGERYVYCIVQGKIKRRAIVTGLSNLERSEVVQGLSLEDLVVMQPGTAELKEGLSVTVEPSVPPSV